MKKLIEETNEGMESLIGEVVTLFCLNYFYTGKLVGVSDSEVKLENPKIIYETGPFTDKKWKDAQSLETKYLYVRISCIESFGILK